MCAAPEAGGDAARTVGFEVLDRAECVLLLRGERLGRLGVATEGGVDIFPVNYAVADDAVVFRTAGGTKLDAVVRTTPVCFEVDGSDAEYHGGWSVVVHGRGEEVLRRVDRARLATLPLRPWADGERDHWVRLPISDVTGRRVRHHYDDRR